MADTTTQARIQGVRTVGVPVADQQRALSFYVEKLGFEKRLDAEFGPGKRWIEVAPPGSTTSIALIATNPGGFGVDTQIRLTTTDAEATHAWLVAAGVEVDTEILRVPVPMFAIHDQDGNRLVIVEQPDDRGEGSKF